MYVKTDKKFVLLVKKIQFLNSYIVQFNKKHTLKVTFEKKVQGVKKIVHVSKSKFIGYSVVYHILKFFTKKSIFFGVDSISSARF